MLTSDFADPLDFRLKNVKITAREKGADFPIFEAKNCKYIEFDNVTIEGFANPYVISDNKDIINIKGGTAVQVK